MLGRGLSIIIDILNPEKIVLGGVFMRSHALLVPAMKKEIEKVFNEYQSIDHTSVASISAADELKKFKELLDEGIITQAEFDAKKKELLGL